LTTEETHVRRLPPRHLIAVPLTLASIVLLSLGAGALHAQSTPTTSEDPRETPTAPALPPPRVGDRGRYVASHADEGPSGLMPAGAEHVLVEFEWLPSAYVLDVHARLHRANLLAYADYGLRARPLGDDAGPIRLFVFAFHPETGELLLYKTASVTSGASTTGWTLGALAYELQRSSTVTHYPGPGGSHAPKLLCGLVHNLQGRTADHLELDADCILPTAAPPTAALVPQTAGRVGALPAVRLGTPHDTQLHAWVSPQVAYPLRVEHRPSDNSRILIRLESFEAGAGPELPTRAGPIGPALGLTWTTPKPWGLDDAGMDHPFPASAAYQLLVGPQSPSAEFRDYAQRHADAFTFLAHPYHYRNGLTEYHGWRLGLTDGRTHIVKCVDRYTYHPLREVDPDLPMADTAVPHETIDARHCPLTPSEAASLPSRPPQRLPTVASLAPRWGLFAGDDPSLVNAWWLDVRCPDYACPNPTIEAGIGHVRNDHFTRYIDAETASLLVTHTERDERLLRVDGHGRALAYEDHGLTSALTAASVADPPSTDSNRVAAEAPSLAASTLTVRADDVPTGLILTGAGVSALLAAILAWTWPLVKGLLPLYTRVDRATILDHPVRAQLMALIEAEPGVHMREVRRRLQLANGKALHHLRLLERSGHVTAVANGGVRSYYPKGATDYRTMAAAPVLRSGTARALVHAVLRAPGRAEHELATELGISPRTLNYHVLRLRLHGLLDLQATGRTTTVRPTTLAREVVHWLAHAGSPAVTPAPSQPLSRGPG
jgi:predicted transcriptional regulator